MVWKWCAIAARLLGAAACSYEANVPVRPATDIHSSYDNPVAGRFALHINASTLRRTITPTGMICAAYDYSFDGREAFRESVIATFERVAGSVEVVDTPLTQAELAAREMAGMIQVSAEAMDVALLGIEGVWTGGLLMTDDIQASVELAVDLTVDGRDGRAFDTTIRADEVGFADGGSACDGGAGAISRAMGNAMQELMETMGERFSNSPRVRALHGGRPGDPQQTSEG